MNANDIIITSGTNYAEMAKHICEAARLDELIGSKEARIALKPNLVVAKPADSGATTHPEVLEGVITYLNEHGFSDIVIMEGSWVGERTKRAFEVSGLAALARRFNVRIIDTQGSNSHEADCGGVKLKLCDCLNDVDFLINLPVMKGHCQTSVTCALKNMKGVIPNSEKRRFHSMGLDKLIAHLNAGIKQGFILVDAICGDLNFEEGGNPVSRNQLFGFIDPVLCDAYACELMGYDISEVQYIGIAERLGVGVSDTKSANYIILNAPAAGASPRSTRRVQALAKNVEQRSACSACYANLIYALERLNGTNKSVCIGQGFRGKAGELGIGSCCAGFNEYVKGCPPTAREILDFLSEHI